MSTGAYVEFLEDGLDVFFHGSGADQKVPGNLAGAESIREQRTKLHLA
jgi:hypothetical protein